MTPAVLGQRDAVKRHTAMGGANGAALKARRVSTMNPSDELVDMAVADRCYWHALDLGCGYGLRARWFASRCNRYTGIDASASHIGRARQLVPHAHFIHARLPVSLPPEDYDLIVIGGLLHRLDRVRRHWLANTIRLRWPGADIVSFREITTGSSADGISQAFADFARHLGREFSIAAPVHTFQYTIERLHPVR